VGQSGVKRAVRLCLEVRRIDVFLCNGVMMCVFVGDIVKQVIKSKLGNSSFNGNCMEAGTIANLTS